MKQTAPPKMPNDQSSKNIMITINRMKHVNLTGLAAVSLLCLAGCTKSEDPVVVAPPPAAPPAVNMTPSAPPTTAPTPDAPPPVAGGAAIMPPAAEAEAKVADAEGKPLPILDYMNLIVEGYERTRAGMTEGTPWPPITDLNQLVQVGYVKRLPAAPEGQKFQFNPETKKVTLVPK